MTNHLGLAMDKLKATGVRMTPQRHAILAYLFETMEHPTADDIYKALEEKFPSMSVATVYNNLRLFKEAHLVRELTYGDASSRFDANVSDHYHAICRQCGKIADFDYPFLDEIQTAATKETGFQVDSHRLEVYGLCEECHSVRKAN
ncbi:peroxide-responsive transcriptional repressor PerR [Bacillus horti]|uniref:Fur family peroxide stress response transcriptional regulator n=1 Tax=Caldalkalibacillus horti TaxID=77523 RepID=A0ABT9W1G4_9BACI|nr:peroxide-responsive transcriptional repressor PerR [Bacillus horti]MDQ0167082.1 Fur family peroxide stress response transcriptional regulator [Bacillus horti]